jgi:hypothetical protein
MKFYIKEWDDQTVSLMTSMGHVLGYFPSVYDALQTCEAWYQHNKKEPQHEVLVHSRDTAPSDFDHPEAA